MVSNAGAESPRAPAAWALTPARQVASREGGRLAPDPGLFSGHSQAPLQEYHKQPHTAGVQLPSGTWQGPEGRCILALLWVLCFARGETPGFGFCQGRSRDGECLRTEGSGRRLPVGESPILSGFVFITK